MRALQVNSPCYIYLLSCRGTTFHKIGIAKDIDARIDTLQPSCPIEIVEVASVLMPNRSSALIKEDELHLKHKSKRLHGEWFTFSEEEVEVVKNEMLW